MASPGRGQALVPLPRSGHLGNATKSLFPVSGHRYAGFAGYRPGLGRRPTPWPALLASSGRFAGVGVSQSLYSLWSVRRGLSKPLHQVLRTGKWPEVVGHALHSASGEGLYFVHEMWRCLSQWRDPANPAYSRGNHPARAHGARPHRQAPVLVLPGQDLWGMLSCLPAA